MCGPSFLFYDHRTQYQANCHNHCYTRNITYTLVHLVRLVRIHVPPNNTLIPTVSSPAIYIYIYTHMYICIYIYDTFIFFVLFIYIYIYITINVYIYIYIYIYSPKGSHAAACLSEARDVLRPRAVCCPESAPHAAAAKERAISKCLAIS
jgi:hypothetical protein